MNTFVDWIYCSIGFYCTVRKGFANQEKTVCLLQVFLNFLVLYLLSLLQLQKRLILYT